MEETMNSGEQPSDRKRGLLKKLIPLINTKIGKELDPIETEAIAFAIESSPQEPITAEAFLKATLGVQDHDTPVDAALHIHTSVYEAKLRKIGELIDQNPSDAARLQRFKENIAIGHVQTLANHQEGKVAYVGAVRRDWIPNWHHPRQVLPQQTQQGK